MVYLISGLQILFLNLYSFTSEMKENTNQNSSSQAPMIISELIKDDGVFPNNEKLPLLVYKGALELPSDDAAHSVERMFRENSWGGTWRNGIYSFHHYHSTAHEVLGVYGGNARVQFGGPEGILLEVEKGDVVLIPAGVAHKNVGQSTDFRVVGAYPKGQSWDTNYGKSGERPQADKNIEKVPLPDTDPIFGSFGPLKDYWVQ